MTDKAIKKKRRFARAVLSMRALRTLCVGFWLPAIAVLTLPASQFQPQVEAARLMILKPMTLGLRSTTASYRLPVDNASLAPPALNRVKRFAYLSQRSRGVTHHLVVSARLATPAQGIVPRLRCRLTLNPRSPPSA
jgi:hypothetical protein